MAERYTRLYTLPENLYTEGAPLVIAAGALLKDNQTGKVLAQLKYRSISSRPIRAIKVLITGYDMAKTEVCREEHQYLDLEMGRDDYWGAKEAVYLPDRSVRSYSAEVLAVYYADGGSYVSDSRNWEPLQEQAGLDTKLWDKELAKQYRIDTTPKSAFVPMRQKDLWLCACGEINRGGEHCHVCGQELDMLIAKLDVDTLRKEKTERLRREAEHASAVDAVRDEHAKKAKKIARIAAPIAVIAAAAIVFSVISSRNARAYDDALALLEAGRYNEADVAFTKLGNYKDSAEKAAEAAGKGQENTAYAKACKLLDNKSYDEAHDAFIALGDYEDSAEKANEALYQKADKLFEDGSFDEAYELYTGLGDYGDSTEKASKAMYQNAGELLENGSFDEAYELYTKLGDYRDSAERAEGFVQRMVRMTVSYDESCSGPLTTTYAYNSEGVLLSETQLYSEYPSMDDQTYEYAYESDGSYTLTRDQVSSAYDAYGNFLGQGGALQYNYQYEYYDDGTVRSCSAYADGTEYALWVMMFDDHGNMEKYTEGDAVYDFVNTYEGELLVRQDKYDANGTLIGGIKYEYDDEGRRTKTTVIENGDTVRSVVTDYVYGYVYAPDAKAAEEAKQAEVEADAQSEDTDSAEDAAAETAEPEAADEAAQ